MAADVLQRLSLFTGEAEYERAGLSAIRLVRDLMSRAPSAFGQALSALDLYLSKPKEVAIVGDPQAEDTRRLAAQIHGRFLPNVALAVGPSDSTIPLLQDRPQLDGRATAYVCEGFVCQRPVTESEALAAQLTS